MANVYTAPSRGTALALPLCIILVALTLRPSMAAIGPLLGAIRQDVPLSFSAASLLTMLPVMAMGLAMFTGSRVAGLLGEHRAIAASLMVIGLATASRMLIDTQLQLIASAVVAGLGIAVVQALMPVLIKSRFGSQVSLYMGLYVTAIMGGAAMAASFSPWVLGQSGDWRLGLAIWALLPLVALPWWHTQRATMAGRNTPALHAAQAPERFWCHSRAWLLAIFFGLGTASYTCVLAWLAPYYVEKGWPEQDAGLMLGLLTALEVVSGLVSPALANRSQDRRAALAVLLLLIIAGFAGLIMAPGHVSLLWPCLLGLGIGGLFPMSLIVSMDHLDNPGRAGRLTAFVQGIGYLIAGLSPLLAGLIRDRLHSFEWAWTGLAGVMGLMILMAWRFDPRHYTRHFGG